MTDWQPIETAPISHETILATWGTKSAVYGIDVVQRVKNGWQSTVFDSIYADGVTSLGYRLLKWMPAPPLHLSEDDVERAKNVAALDAWVAGGCEGEIEESKPGSISFAGSGADRWKEIYEMMLSTPSAD
jgi:hypothetical protein